ncbi:hypothetical protein SCLCIDRAFT_320349 [Scleroderma citrinum Foug A]|uniref:Uncharacterized protein n=1 Tax=Scleroderma citrinum Foug A TaxID=1036808 RepID=A0A0C3EER0_9AGAM|nr:hypothetical protein SCLCIDRAFT_320349 [Scleroderma citrinum Foug A]
MSADTRNSNNVVTITPNVSPTTISGIGIDWKPLDNNTRLFYSLYCCKSTWRQPKFHGIRRKSIHGQEVGPIWYVRKSAAPFERSS